MKKILFLTVFIFCVSLINLNIYAQNNADRNLIAQAEQVSGDKFQFVAKTNKGAKVYGVVKPSQKMLTAIDNGLTDLFAIAKKNRYAKRLSYSDYTIFIAKPDRLTDSDGNYIPNFSIPVRQYAGTDFDKGGYMYVAGMVINYNPCAFIIADNTQKLEQVSDVVRYEGEHLVLYHNDRRRYNQTADHSKGGAHPILN